MTDHVPHLYDADTNEDLGEATEEQAERSESASLRNAAGIIAINEDGDVLGEDEVTPTSRRVYTA